MKIKITEARFDSNHSGNFTVELKDNDGNVVLTTTRGFLSKETDVEKVNNEILKSLQNIKDQYVSEQASVAKQEMLKAIGKEYEVRFDAETKKDVLEIAKEEIVK